MKIQATTADAYNLFHKGILALGRAERQGMRIDVEYCEKKIKQLSRKIERLEEEILDSKFGRHWNKSIKAKLNLHSNHQLAAFLYKVKKIEPEKFTTEEEKQGSVDDEALSQLGIPELDLLLKARKLKKVKDTYLTPFLREQVDGILHPFFNLNLARSFRSSSDHPNFQNIPSRDEEAMKICRRAILPRPGHQLVELDYSGIEVRISECYHKDPKMMEYIKNPKTDMHRDMAIQIFKLHGFDKSFPAHKYLRGAAKNGFVFPQFYGDYYVNCAHNLASSWGELPKGRWKEGQGMVMATSGGNLADHLISQGIKSFDQFVQHIKEVEEDFWGNRFRVYEQWKERSWRAYQKKGYMDLLTGFRVSGMMDRKQVSNIPIQGAAFHCLLWSFIKLDEIQQKRKWDSRLIGQIHDATLFDMHPDELGEVIETSEQVMCQDLVEAWKWIIVPLEIETEVCGVDESWDKKKPYEEVA